MISQPNNKLALSVKSFIDWTIGDTIEFFEEVYSNGREQGFALYTINGRKAVFSEHRTSDSIIIYLGRVVDFDFNTNIPNDKIWTKSILLPCQEIAHAADIIIDHLKG